MGRVPKKHRRPVEYTEAVDADEINKSVENAEDANVGVGGDKEIEKSISENGSGKVDLDDTDDFKSIHSDTDYNDESKPNECAVEESDDEPLKKTARAAKNSSKEKRDSNGDSAPKKKARKIAKKTPPKMDEEYEVQDIMAHKVDRGIDFYLVRWKGYTKEDDTWEPSTTLSCPDLIQKFKKKQSLTKEKLKNKASVGEKKAGKPRSNIKPQYDPDKQWEVEKIIDYAQEKSGRIFRIRWKGYGSKHDTWEPERNLSCDEVIAKFMQRIKSQEYVSFKELRVDPKKPKRLVNETSLRTNYSNAIGRKSKRASSKKRVFYGDSD